MKSKDLLLFVALLGQQVFAQDASKGCKLKTFPELNKLKAQMEQLEFNKKYLNKDFRYRKGKAYKLLKPVPDINSSPDLFYANGELKNPEQFGLKKGYKQASETPQPFPSIDSSPELFYANGEIKDPKKWNLPKGHKQVAQELQPFPSIDSSPDLFYANGEIKDPKKWNLPKGHKQTATNPQPIPDRTMSPELFNGDGSLKNPEKFNLPKGHKQLSDSATEDECSSLMPNATAQVQNANRDQVPADIKRQVDGARINPEQVRQQ